MDRQKDGELGTENFKFMKLKFIALVSGGEGPDVWDKELCMDACDILDAMNQAIHWTKHKGGTVMSVVQMNWDYEKVIAYRTKDHPEANGRVPGAGEVKYAIELPLEDGRSLALHMGSKCFEVLGNHLIDMMSQAPSHNDGSCRTM